MDPKFHRMQEQSFKLSGIEIVCARGPIIKEEKSITYEL